MGQSIRDVMSTDPIVLQQGASIQEAAQVMRDEDIGDVIVLDDSQQICGIITDRDIVVRAVAQGREPQSLTVGEICSRDLQTLSPNDDIGDAVKTMSDQAIRRLPVVEKGRPVGIVSIGDLAVTRDPDSALADISAAPANN
jgi:signal-transduction protein with cAMP-binding, CBS, and nucleotidyltransferase domain